MTLPLSDLDDIVAAFGRGEFVALLDDPEREGEADLLQAAVHVTGASLNAMLTYARGLITVAVAPELLERLDIPLLPVRFAEPTTPRFAEPVDYKHGTTTGVSTYDRAVTIRALLDPQATPEDFARPGHVFPLAEAEGGLACRRGHTEGAVALARLAGLPPAVVMCEIMAPDGHMANRDEVAELCRRRGIYMVTVQQVSERLAAPAADQ